MKGNQNPFRTTAPQKNPGQQSLLEEKSTIARGTWSQISQKNTNKVNDLGEVVNWACPVNPSLIILPSLLQMKSNRMYNPAHIVYCKTWYSFKNENFYGIVLIYTSLKPYAMQVRDESYLLKNKNKNFTWKLLYREMMRYFFKN